MNSRGFPRHILYVYHVNWGKPNRGINFKVMHAHVLTKNGPPPLSKYPFRSMYVTLEMESMRHAQRP